MDSTTPKSEKKEKKDKKKSSKKSGKKEKSSSKRSRDEKEEAAPTPTSGNKKAKEDVKPVVDVKPDAKDEKKPNKDEKKAKAKKPKEDRPIRYFPLTPIAQPLASPDLQKSLFAVLAQAAKAKQLRRGVKEIQKALRKKEQGVMVIAGDVEPLDVISHVPVLCEDHQIPYIFVRSKEELGAASQTKRPTSCILIKPKSDYQKEFDEVKKQIKPIIY